MYSRLQLAKKYIRYYLGAANGKGHGTHSPFVFDFIIHVLNDDKHYDIYDKAEAIRLKMLRDTRQISVDDFGAGSTVLSARSRKVSDIARSSLKPKKYAQLIFRIARYYQCRHIIELGTSLGITSCYLAAAGEDVALHTLEGATTIANIARENFKEAGLNNIYLVQGNFEQTLPALINEQGPPDLVFIDGNHRKTPTLAYFEMFRNKAHENTILIFDDIHWSEEMEEAWQEIIACPGVTCSIDLFFIGIVFFRKNFKATQNFTIRF